MIHLILNILILALGLWFWKANGKIEISKITKRLKAKSLRNIEIDYEFYTKKLCRIRHNINTRELFEIISYDAGFRYDAKTLDHHEKNYLFKSEIPIYVEIFIDKNKKQIDEIIL